MDDHHTRISEGTPAAVRLTNGVVRTCAARGHVVPEIGVVGNRVWPAAALAGAPTVDLGGRCVVPGFWDSHVHFATWALVQRQLRLEGASSAEEVLARVGDAARGAPAGAWLRGFGWYEGGWAEPVITRRLADRLDAVTGAVPVVLTSRDYHSVWVNSAAMARADGDLRVPGGVVDVDGEGRPLGVLREASAWNFRDTVARPTDEELLAATRAALPLAHARGVTAVHDKDGWLHALRIWERLRSAGQLRLRVWQSLPAEYLAELESLGLRSGFGDDWLSIGYIKLFHDGSLSSGTALLADGRGVTVSSPERLRDQIVSAARQGLPVAIHAIGDRANQQVLDLFEQTRGEWEPQGLRQRIEHGQLLRDDDIARFAELGVALSAQFSHVATDRDLADVAWSGMTHRAYRFRSLWDAGTHICNGSDAPTDELDPLRGIQVGVLRSDDGRPAWHPEECLSVEDALWATTVNPAWLARAEDRLGRVAPGYLADLVVLDRDPVDCPPEELGEVTVVATMLDGEWVHNPPPWE